MPDEKADKVDSIVDMIQKFIQSEEFQKILHFKLMSRSMKTIADLEELVQKTTYDPTYVLDLLGRIHSIIKKKPPDEPTRRRKTRRRY